MHNRFKIVSLLLVVFSLFITRSAFAEGPDNNDTLPRGLMFMTLDNMMVTDQDVPKDKPLLLFYFQPDCGHCQIEGKKLAKDLGLYPDMEVWLITNYPDLETKAYLYQMGFFPAKRLKVLKDYQSRMHDLFYFEYVPLILLYSPQGKLIKEFDNIPEPEVLNALIKNSVKG